MSLKRPYVFSSLLLLALILLLLNRPFNIVGMAGLTTFGLAYFTKGMRRTS
ncbi:hypothetical protein PJF56_15135 [Roseofilum sp. BLCC_M91]|uniref:Uncharacterized protein n=1 Tax=Roseofilum halophilum BLCC-M91 TaxID=3022259 RepID=A0ABT7BLX1_9CYAN|nr:hypothetical protein [Roseofilum halophilum]MDJ1180197.1 hypothetical protein [Roseofilum halophilum BLCC-M91]